MICILTLFLAGCAKAQEQQEEPEPPKLEIEPIEPEGRTDGKQAKRRPIAVMIPNNAPALPQYGLSRAGIIYEAPVEGRITRLMGVFENFDDLDRIGPVRSSRDYYVYQAMGYEAIYCNWGLAVPYVEELINRPNYYNVSAAVVGIHNPATKPTADISAPATRRNLQDISLLTVCSRQWTGLAMTGIMMMRMCRPSCLLRMM